LKQALAYFDPPAGAINYETHFAKPKTKFELYSPGEGKILIKSGNATLTGLVCPISRNVEHVEIQCSNDPTYFSLVSAFTQEIRSQKLEYAEIYVEARDLEKQMILESLGFLPTGFVPQWYAQRIDDPIDYLIYTVSYPSDLPDCPLSLTKEGEFLRTFFTTPQTPRPIGNRIMTPVTS
jgi:hypothetical protein